MKKYMIHPFSTVKLIHVVVQDTASLINNNNSTIFTSYKLQAYKDSASRVLINYSEQMFPLP